MRGVFALLVLCLAALDSQAMITYQSQSVGYAYGASYVTVTPPYNTSGQFLLAVLTFNNVSGEPFDFINPVVTASPSGWVKILDNSFYGLGVYRALWFKIADGSSSTIQWSFDSALRGEAVILDYAGVDASSPVNSFSFKNDYLLSTNHYTNAVTTDYAGCCVIGAWFSADTGIAFYDPNLDDMRVSLEGLSMQAQRALAIGDGIQSIAGSSGVKNAVSNSQSYCQSMMVALKPQ